MSRKANDEMYFTSQPSTTVTMPRPPNEKQENALRIMNRNRSDEDTFANVLTASKVVIKPERAKPLVCCKKKEPGAFLLKCHPMSKKMNTSNIVCNKDSHRSRAMPIRPSQKTVAGYS